MLVAQITDLHISTFESANDTIYHTPQHLERAIARLNGLPNRPDVVLLTGDLVERGGADEYARLRHLLSALQMPFYAVPGNHDSREGIAAAFADCPWMPRSGFVQYAVEEWPLRLVGLDTVVPGRPGGRLCAERLAWLDARLAEQPARPTVLFMHHPPFDTGIASMDAMGLEGKDDLAAVIRRHPQVERILCGHVHRSITARFAGTIAMVCPSTAHQIALDLPPERRLAVVMEPPALLLHWWNPGTGLVTHTQPIDPQPPTFTLYDGARWLDDSRPPAGFQRTPGVG